MPAPRLSKSRISGGLGVVATLGPMLANAFVGVVAGGLVLGVVTLASRLKGGKKAAH